MAQILHFLGGSQLWTLMVLMAMKGGKGNYLLFICLFPFGVCLHHPA